MAHQQESFLPFSSRQSLSCCLSRMAKRSTPKPRGPLSALPKPHGPPSLWLPCLGLNLSTSLPLQPHFQLLLQSVTPASIPMFFQLYWAAIVSLGRCGPMAWSQSSPSSHTALQPGVASHLHHGLKSLPSPWLKAWPQLFNISMKPVKGYRYVKWPRQGQAAQLLLYKTALNGMALLHVSLPPAHACGDEDILYIFSNISWTPWVLDPITNPYLGPSSWLYLVNHTYTSILAGSPEIFLHFIMTLVHCCKF